MQQLERRESTRVRSGVILSSQTRPLSHLFWFCQVSQSMSSHVHLGFVINPTGHIGLTSRDRTQPCGKHSAVWFSCWKQVVYFSNWLKKCVAKKKQQKKSYWSDPVDTACRHQLCPKFFSRRALIMSYWSAAACADRRRRHFCTVTVYLPGEAAPSELADAGALRAKADGK